MKKIFSDEIVSKLRRIPSPVWVICVIFSFFFANAYAYLIEGEYIAIQLNTIYTEMGISFNIVTIGIVFSIIEAAIFTAVSEIIISLIYNTVAGRFRAEINRQDFKFRIRYLIIIINLIIGIFSIGYFFTQKINGIYTGKIELFGSIANIIEAENPYYTIQSSILPFIVTSFLAFIFYDDFRKRYVHGRNQTALFSMFLKIYIGIYVLIFVFDIFSNFLILEEVVYDVYTIIAYCLKGVAIIIVGILSYLYYKRLDKDTKTNINTNVTNESNNSNTNIFDDFGF